jgi:hypothetical protein
MKRLLFIIVFHLPLVVPAQVKTYLGKGETFFRKNFPDCDFNSSQDMIMAFNCNVSYAAFDSNGHCTYYILKESKLFIDALDCNLSGVQKKFYTNSRKRETTRYIFKDFFLDIERVSDKSSYFFVTIATLKHDGWMVYRDFSAEKYLKDE